RSDRDWSSDVCSSDLAVYDRPGSRSETLRAVIDRPYRNRGIKAGRRDCRTPARTTFSFLTLGAGPYIWTLQSLETEEPLTSPKRSEERRVGKEGRPRS